MPHLFTINPLDFNTLMYGNDDVVGLLYSMCLFTMDPSDLVIKRPHQCNIFPCISSIAIETRSIKEAYLLSTMDPWHMAHIE